MPRFLFCCLAIAFLSIRCLADTPATQPAADADYTVSPLRVQVLKGSPFVYASTKAKIPTIKQSIRPIMLKLRDSIDAGTIKPRGPVVLLFHGMTSDPDHEFDIDVGVPVEAEAAAGGFQVKKLDDFHCATVIFSGPVGLLKKAYEKLYADIDAAGLQPTDLSAQAMLFWEGELSPNNVIMLMAEVK